MASIRDSETGRRREPPLRRLLGDQAGMTLLEVMLSSVILAFVIVSTLAIISRSSRYLMDLRAYSHSSQLLQQRIEELRAMSWSEITNLPSSFTSTADPQGFYVKSLQCSSYQSFGSNTVVLAVTASAVWTNRHGGVVTNSLVTLVGNGGLNKTTL